MRDPDLALSKNVLDDALNRSVIAPQLAITGASLALACGHDGRWLEDGSGEGERINHGQSKKLASRDRSQDIARARRFAG